MASFSPPISSPLHNPDLTPKISLSLLSTKRFSLVSLTRASSDNGTSTLTVSATTVEVPKPVSPTVEEIPVKSSTESSSDEADLSTTTTTEIKFQDAKWINGTWDLKQFKKEGKTDWDSVIVSEAKRRKWLEDNPETTTNDEPG